MERVSLTEPVRDLPPVPPVPDEDRAWLHGMPESAARAAAEEAPLLALSSAGPPQTTAIATQRHPQGSGRGPIVLLWLSSIALLAGLLMLTRDLRPRRSPGHS